MNMDTTTEAVREIMQRFADLTGLAPAAAPARRYLWTDAFAVCNYLELFRRTDDEAYRELALRLIDQVHHTLGRHRDDDPRSGWISGLPEPEGELHPARGGLRIGKRENERREGEPLDARFEWNRDGQYYHYLTKWMHALNRAGRVTGDPPYTGWAMELAKTAHAAFTNVSLPGGRKGMYWKMSIDLTRPLVPSMGQHDPLDGLVTYSELQAAATRELGGSPGFDLSEEIAGMAEICRGMSWATDDPLGIGGLLFDASRIVRLVIEGGFEHAYLLAGVVESARAGMESFVQAGSLEFPAEYRLAFRELGLAIGLSAVGGMLEGIEENPELFGPNDPLQRTVQALGRYVPLGDEIVEFWVGCSNREADSWSEHREINMVMLATSLAPEEFLAV
ncbi:MAG: hypothetical protein KO206_01035 [Methanomicrobiaceae archaeon]|nr:hypothetical protein [Methanomicrobiaceae archaeon]